MLLSSFSGYVAAGFSVAAVVPSTCAAWANRRNTSHPWFVYPWVLADVANMAAIIILKPVVVQYVIAGTYLVIDVVTLYQLLNYGSDDFGSCVPHNAQQQELERKSRSQAMREFASHCRKWDGKIKIVSMTCMCVCFWVAAWGANYAMQQSNFTGPVVTELPRLAELLGWMANLLWAGARFAEIGHGWILHLRKETVREPIAGTEIMFIYLIVYNMLSFFSIYILSPLPAYQHAEAPWLVGPALATFFDLVLLLSAGVCWGPAHRKRDEENPYHPYEDAKSDLREAHRYGLESEEHLSDVALDKEQRLKAERSKRRADVTMEKARKNAARHEENARNIEQTHEEHRRDHPVAPPPGPSRRSSFSSSSGNGSSSEGEALLPHERSGKPAQSGLPPSARSISTPSTRAARDVKPPHEEQKQTHQRSSKLEGTSSAPPHISEPRHEHLPSPHHADPKHAEHPPPDKVSPKKPTPPHNKTPKKAAPKPGRSTGSSKPKKKK
ncbi:hypothetical protein T439DRAFT_352436 [Meredithblackwellia eburnea MCA 4105]